MLVRRLQAGVVAACIMLLALATAQARASAAGLADAPVTIEQAEAALKDYNAAIGIAPDYQYALVTRCETRLQLGDTSGALADCDTAIRLDSTDAVVYAARCDTNRLVGNRDRAATDCDKALTLDPKSRRAVRAGTPIPPP